MTEHVEGGQPIEWQGPMHAETVPTLGERSLTGANTSIGDAELPDPGEIPDIPPLRFLASMHHHRYEAGNLVSTLADAAEDTPAGQRTEEQKQLLDDRRVLAKFAPYSLHERVYTPGELHGLVERFTVLSRKNRPDFSDTASKAVELILDTTRRLGPSILPADVRAIAKRAETNETLCDTMQWGTLSKLATHASMLLRQNAVRVEGYRKDYFIDVRDPEPRNVADLTQIYQFVADNYAFEMLGERSLESYRTRCTDFVANCEVINAWFAEAKSVLSRVPPFILGERFGAVYEITEMIESMNKRLTGDEMTGRYKAYARDPGGAINLQSKIGYAVAELKRKIADKLADQGEIIPLD